MEIPDKKHGKEINENLKKNKQLDIDWIKIRIKQYLYKWIKIKHLEN